MWQQRPAHAAQSQHSHCEGRKRSVWGAAQGIAGLPICLPLPCLEPPSFDSWRRRGKLALFASPVCPPFFPSSPLQGGGDGWKRARMKRPRQGGLLCRKGAKLHYERQGENECLFGRRWGQRKRTIESIRPQRPSARRPASGPLSLLLFARAVGGGKADPRSVGGEEAAVLAPGARRKKPPCPNGGRGVCSPCPNGGGGPAPPA